MKSSLLFPSWERGARGLNVIEEKQDGRPVGGGPQSNSSCYVSAASAGCSVYSLFMVVEFAVLKFQWGSIQRRLYQAEWFKCTQGAGDSHRCFLHVAGTVCSGRGGGAVSSALDLQASSLAFVRVLSLKTGGHHSFKALIHNVIYECVIITGFFKDTLMELLFLI